MRSSLFSDRVVTSRVATAVLTAGGILTLVVLLHDLYGYGWMGWQQFGAPTIWALQCGVLGGLAIVLFASLRLRPAPRIAVAVAWLSLTVVLYAGELVLAATALGGASMPFWSMPHASHTIALATLARESGVKIDTRDPVQLLADLRRRRIDAVPAVMLGNILATGGGVVRSTESSDSINGDKLMPLGGISSALTVLCNESGQYVIYESDEHGFRNPNGIWSPARADIAAVGESFTQGYCVPDGKGFVDLLRTRYPVTLNLGVSGQSSLLQLAAIKEYLPRYTPRIVLWTFCEGIDLQDLYGESTFPLLMRYLEPAFSRGLLSRQAEVDNGLRRFVAAEEMRERERRATSRGSSLVETSLGIMKLWGLRQRLDLMYGVRGGADARTRSVVQERAYDLLKVTLAQAQTVTSSWGGAIYFVYLPSWTRYRNGPRVSERERTRVLHLVKALGIPVIDTQPAFEAHNDPLSLFPFRRFGHYSEAGNRIVAETILESLSASTSRAGSRRREE